MSKPSVAYTLLRSVSIVALLAVAACDSGGRFGLDAGHGANPGDSSNNHDDDTSESDTSGGGGAGGGISGDGAKATGGGLQGSAGFVAESGGSASSPGNGGGSGGSILPGISTGGGNGGGGNNGGNNGGGTIIVGSSGLLDRVSGGTGVIAGEALVTVGNALLDVATNLPPLPASPASGLVNAVTTTVANLGTAVSTIGGNLQTGGLGGLPVVGGVVDTATAAADGLTNGLATLDVAGQTIVGSGQPGSNSAIGIGLLSPAAPSGSVASVGLASGGSVIDASIATPGGNVAVSDVASLTVGGLNVIGNGSSTPAIGIGVLTPATPSGSVASVGIGTGGSAVDASIATPAGSVGIASVAVGGTSVVGSGAAAPVVGVGILSPAAPAGAVAAVGIGTGASIVDVAVATPAAPAVSIVDLNVGNANVVGSQPAAVGIALLSPSAPEGGVAAVGVLSGGNIISVEVPGVTPPAPSAAVLPDVGAAVSGVVNGTVGAVTGVVGGLVGTLNGATAPAASPTNGITSGLKGLFGHKN